MLKCFSYKSKVLFSTRNCSHKFKCAFPGKVLVVAFLNVVVEWRLFIAMLQIQIHVYNATGGFCLSYNIIDVTSVMSLNNWN